MDAIASCYIGGAATTGGVGTIIGAVVGAFIMGILNNGMSLYGWSTDIQKIVKGAVPVSYTHLDVYKRQVVIGGRGWTKTSDYWTVRWAVTESIKEEFDRAGIEIPFNQMEVTIRNERG